MSGSGRRAWSYPEKKHLYFLNEGSWEESGLLGLKGSNLCQMFQLQLPVPPAFIITTESSLEFFAQKTDHLEEHALAQIKKGIQVLESQTGKTFGKHEPLHTPLLLSVRLGAAIEMPGAMQTVLNLGMNDEIVEALAELTSKPRWAYDCYRRFLQMYGTVVLGTDSAMYDAVLMEARTARGVAKDTQLTVADLVEVVTKFKTFAEVPQDPWEQLLKTVESCFSSWLNPAAVKYRDIHCIQEELGTAVVVQSMVYGNWNARSGTGVMSTRNPQTGAKEMYGEFLQNAEGQDVIAGDRVPMKLSELQQSQPALYDKLRDIESVLERHYKDMQVMGEGWWVMGDGR
ncbi:phosphoenolpyruvate synthase/pyruvate phosphate dikinase [Ochromonadaceae sp. CCMP2298]|nr:phosphoenolpyruvate synthase/pyruvate phosphate dikinase [Ochromonadaceae sp. CCMP2298]